LTANLEHSRACGRINLLDFPSSKPILVVFIGQEEGFLIKNYIGPLLGLALVSISGATATAQQKSTEPATVTSAMGRSFRLGGYESTIKPVFEVVSIKPNKSGDALVGIQSTTDGFTATNYTLQKLIRVAYGVQDDQISGGPNWLNSLRYDVDAKMDGSVADELQKS
jgi:Protein of unknown function (DUF3738)